MLVTGPKLSNDSQFTEKKNTQMTQLRCDEENDSLAKQLIFSLCRCGGQLVERPISLYLVTQETSVL